MEHQEPPSIAKDFPDPAPLPGWAIEYVIASLRVGLLVPDIQERLVAKGLTAAVAATVVNKVIESCVAERSEPFAESEWGKWMHRALSVVLGGICIILAHRFGGGLSVGRTVISLLLPLAWIWFPEAMSRSVHGAAYLRWPGWLLLFMVAGYRIVLLLNTA